MGATTSESRGARPSGRPTRQHASTRRRVFRRRRITIGIAFLLVFGVFLVTCNGGATAPTGSAAHRSPPRTPSRVGVSRSSATVVARDAAGLAKHWSYKGWLAYLEEKVKGRPGHLQPGSNPAALPGPVLIADRNNSRVLLIDPKGRILWQFPVPGDLRAGQTFLSPDDAFFGPHGRHIVITQESQFVITIVSLRTGHITWRYGHPTVAGSSPGYLDNPDDAMLLPNGNVMTADIKNCRLLELSRLSSTPLHIYGTTDQYCFHQPPYRFGSPNGMFPMTNGNWLVTEINGDWVDQMTPSGRILWTVHPPGISYPSDTNQVSSDVFLTAAYTDPGVVEEFDSTGQLLWRYAPAGAAALDRPSLALPLPNGDVLLNDDWNHRVIVVDPKTDQVVWQYGVTGVAGTAPGYLDKPDGVDLAPPNSLLMTHAATMGTPPFGAG